MAMGFSNNLRMPQDPSMQDEDVPRPHTGFDPYQMGSPLPAPPGSDGFKGGNLDASGGSYDGSGITGGVLAQIAQKMGGNRGINPGGMMKPQVEPHLPQGPQGNAYGYYENSPKAPEASAAPVPEVAAGPSIGAGIGQAAGSGLEQALMQQALQDKLAAPKAKAKGHKFLGIF